MKVSTRTLLRDLEPTLLSTGMGEQLASIVRASQSADAPNVLAASTIVTIIGLKQPSLGRVSFYYKTLTISRRLFL